MDASTRTGCLPSTRADILKFIVEWVDDRTSQQTVLWLHGLAGSGKSTLSTTIASIYGNSGRLGAFLFFDRDITERSDPTMVIRTLAYQLASSDARIGAAIRAVVERNPNIMMLPLHLQFRKLISDPLSTIEVPPRLAIIVIDALDECGTAATRESLLELLSDVSNLSLHFRTIITSRATIDIFNALESQQHIFIYELDIRSAANSDDILKYFRHCMTRLRTQKRHLQLGIEWPGEVVFHQLVDRASGLFVWASTAWEFINGHDPRRRLDVILREDIASDAEAALDVLYKTALESIGFWDDEDFISDFRAILGVILVARVPLSSASIDAFLRLPKDRPSMYTISLLGCVLQQNPCVRILHPSFADFLMTPQRCKWDTWFFDRATYHRRLAFHCLDCMDAVLKQNMCGMTLSADRTNENLSEHVSYSCLFWIDHISVIEDNLVPVIDRLRGFLCQHLLHWFEAMSIMKRSRDTISLVSCLMNWVSVSQLDSLQYHHLSENSAPCSP